MQAHSLSHGGQVGIRFIPLSRSPGLSQQTERKTEALCSCITPRAGRDLIQDLSERHSGSIDPEIDASSPEFAVKLAEEPLLLESFMEFLVENCTFDITEPEHVDFLQDYLGPGRFQRIKMCQRMNYWNYSPGGATITQRLGSLEEILVRLILQHHESLEPGTISVLSRCVACTQVRAALMTESLAHCPKDTEVHSFELTPFPKSFFVHVLVDPHTNLIRHGKRQDRQEIVWEMMKRVVARAITEVDFERNGQGVKPGVSCRVQTNGHVTPRLGQPNKYTSQGDITPPEDWEVNAIAETCTV